MCDEAVAAEAAKRYAGDLARILVRIRVKAVAVRMEHVFLNVELKEEDLVRLCGRYHFGDAGLAALRKMYARLAAGEAYSAESGALPAENGVYLAENGTLSAGNGAYSAESRPLPAENAPCRVSMYYTLEAEQAEGSEAAESRGEREAVVLLTLGTGPDVLEERLMKEERLSEAYMVECLSMELLAAAYEEADRRIHEESGLWCQNYEFPGAERPLEEMRRLFALLNQEEVRYNEAYALIPLKSVIYTAKLARRPPETDRGKNLCAGCSRTDCGRKTGRQETCGRVDDRRTDCNRKTGRQDICGGAGDSRSDCNRKDVGVSGGVKGAQGRMLNYGYRRIFGSGEGRETLQAASGVGSGTDRRERTEDE